MEISVRNVLIHRDTVTKISKSIWAWEAPVLEAKFGSGKVEYRDDSIKEVAQLPDAASEYHRLASAHGSDHGGTNILFVELAYGRGKAGIDALNDMIQECRVAKKPKKAKKKAAVKKPMPPVVEPDDAGAGDPLAETA